MPVISQLRPFRFIDNATKRYARAYKQALAQFEGASFVEKGVIWRKLVQKLDREWMIFMRIAGACATSVIGLLSTSSIPSGPLTFAFGMVCVEASAFCFAYCVVYRIYMPRMNEHLRGFDWLAESKAVPDSSWKSAPRLLTVPAGWMACATVTFVAFLLTELWVGIGGDSVAQSRKGSVVLSAIATIELVGGLIQAAFVMPAFMRLYKPVDSLV
ncbi:uncharacterized protein B0H18DRAFT_1116673 [Fomitopsis serialis]|nr:uncharacterized protein B0H18DRAFT_1116673 [Neoantrodia serialis]KAH9930979.1 hypothetical protein B0H18DRAFT_1116673 [Neoantrodia serialis]